MRLNAIAQVRAQTMAVRISAKVFHPGQPWVSRAATAIEASAKGRAKTVWESLTKPAHFERERKGEDEGWRMEDGVGDTGISPFYLAIEPQACGKRQYDPELA